MIYLTFVVILSVGFIIGYYTNALFKKIKNGFTVDIGGTRITVEKKTKPVFNRARFPAQQ